MLNIPVDMEVPYSSFNRFLKFIFALKFASGKMEKSADSFEFQPSWKHYLLFC